MENKKEQILQAYQFRHACKEFDPTKKISDEDFHFILETGRLSPSSFGLEPWKFVVIQNPEVREKISSAAWGQKQVTTSSHFVVILARTKADLTYDSEYLSTLFNDVKKLPEAAKEGLTKAIKRFQEVDFNLESDRAIFDWACRQTYIALGNMMTAAAQIGIDSCPMEGFNKEQVEQILKEEGIMQGDFGVSCLVAFGYRVNDPASPKTRQTMDMVVDWVK
ncbi:NAD(P)H-dependent oxidoreductase [Thermoflavimicrobium daqui]|uniref:NAD(P)H-dependent oxidoreductase n=2 Tax=Thermoflavimicrobium daqui TaxID=2137476 RepID=A0A364K4L7_9BACL|nr:NAD(P)H-dependent oxidoreductase [Thermoflavimicrobium daqui]